MLNTGNVLPVKLQPPLLRPMAYRVLSKKFGLNIKSDGLAALADNVGNLFGMNWRKDPETLQFLERFAVLWRQQERGLFVDRQGVQDVVNEMKERERANMSTSAEQEHLKKPTGITIDQMLTKQPHLAAPGDSPSPDLEEEAESEKIIIEKDSLPENHKVAEAHDQLEWDEDQLDWRNYFKVVNAAEQTRFFYDPLKMQFIFRPMTKNDVAPDFTSRFSNTVPDIALNTSIFPTRFHLVRDRVMRNENFQSIDEFNPLSSIAAMQQDLDNVSGQATASITITQIKNLLGRDGQNFLLLGLLSRNSKGNWSLEDLTGSIEIDITQVLPTKGLYYVPGCFVLVEGIYFTAGHKFHVSSMTHPPGEKRENTLEAIGNLDLLNLHGPASSSYIARLDKELKIRLHYLEKELTDHRFVILGGDIFLDEIDTLQALKKVFMRLNEDPPIAIIFQGSFTAVPVHASMSSRNISSTVQYKNNFDNLATLISEFDNIAQNCTLIFIPGVNDPWSSMVSMGSAHAWPQQPVPSRFTQKMEKVCKHIIWASNPTRLAYLSQELVIARDDITERLKRHSISFPAENLAQETNAAEVNIPGTEVSDEGTSMSWLIKETDQLPTRIRESRKLVKTLLDQGHLSPFTKSIRPLVWNLDNSLTLHPIPSTLIVCDTTAPQFDLTYNGCKAINPGRFIIGKRAKYIEYRSSLKKAFLEELYF